MCSLGSVLLEEYDPLVYMTMNDKEEKHMMKRILALLTALAMLLGCAAAETAPTESAYRIEEKKNVPIFISATEMLPGDGMSLYFVDGADDLPYVNVKDWADMLNVAYAGYPQYAGFAVTAETEEEPGIVQLKRENGHMMVFDFANNQIVWDDYLGFLQTTNGTYLDMSGMPDTDDEGRPVYLSRVSARERHGDSTSLKLSDYYGISIIAQDGLYLAPMQTLSAFTFAPLFFGMYYNQECLIASSVIGMDNIKAKLLEYLYTNGVLTDEIMMEAHEKYPDSVEDREKYYMEKAAESEMGQAIIAQVEAGFAQTNYGLYAGTSPKGNRSEALVNYGYGELCMELDFFYGLKDAHHIDHFSDYFVQIDKAVDLLNPDALTADQAVYDTVLYWLDDGHSAPVSHSYLVDPGKDNEMNVGFSYQTREGASSVFDNLRPQYPEALQPYYEVGNTAYVTFNEFYMTSGVDYYEAAEKGELPDLSRDTLSLLYYANQQIRRENSPIENVVLDLSTNGGGHAPAALWTVSWFLGEAHMSVFHTATGAESTVTYRADVNFDHQFDENDTLADLNLYCITGPGSFSCGNLVPWAFKADGQVTLLGRMSGGGSCSVNFMTTAWGTSFRLSSPNRLSFVKNGSYYDVDQGCEPDYFIRDFRNVYDRNALTELINGLF